LRAGRCQFEQGKAPVFNLLEAGSGAVSWLSGRQRKVTFQAPSVEECCEWASERGGALSTGEWSVGGECQTPSVGFASASLSGLLVSLASWSET
jgi:hypothetical protein